MNLAIDVAILPMAWKILLTILSAIQNGCLRNYTFLFYRMLIIIIIMSTTQSEKKHKAQMVREQN